MGRVSLSGLLVLIAVVQPAAQVRLADASDRTAFQQWFVYLADAQYYRTTSDVLDCAGLVRHAAREALRAHTPEWLRTATLPVVRTFPDVRDRPPVVGGSIALFQISGGARPKHAEFADARTIVRLNARALGRDVAVLQPGDLLYFRQPEQAAPDHVMVYVGPSVFEELGRDWIVYHTGPLNPGRGEVRKVRLSDLVRHPAPRWRPLAANAAFVGVFRLNWL